MYVYMYFICVCVYICSLLPGNNDNYVNGNHSIILLHAK